MLEFVMSIWVALASLTAPAPEPAPAPRVTAAAVTVEAPAPAPKVVDLSSTDGTVTPLCKWEDSNGCMWNAAEMGNGIGTSFVAGTDGAVAKNSDPVVVTCTTPDGYTYTYGGTAQSAVDLCWQGERRVTN